MGLAPNRATIEAAARGGKRCERCERCSCKDFPTGVKNSGEEHYYYRKYLFVTGPGFLFIYQIQIRIFIIFCSAHNSNNNGAHGHKSLAYVQCSMISADSVYVVSVIAWLDDSKISHLFLRDCSKNFATLIIRSGSFPNRSS